MTPPPIRRAVRTALALAALAALVTAPACDHPYAPGLDDYPAQLAARKGTIAAVDTTIVDQGPGHVTVDFRLTSTTGLVVRGRYRADPAAGPHDRRPLVILLGGIDRGGAAVDLVPLDVAPAAAALWYPEALDADDAADAIRRLDELSDLAWDIPASLLLAVDFLVDRPGVDPDRIATVGASFGGFFVPAAAGADPRIRNVGLMYAGGDLSTLLATWLRDEVPPPAAVLGAELATLRLQRLEPTRYVGDIAPRHVLLVNGLHDHLVPPRSARALAAATGQPRDHVWLPTGHLDPRNESLLRELVDTALARLPVLRTP